MAAARLGSAPPCQHCARERLDEQARRHRLVAELGELAASVRVHEAARRKEVEELMSEREWLLDSLRVACAALREADAERASRLSLPSELELLNGAADSRDGGRGDGGGGNGGGDGGGDCAGGEGRAGEGGGGEGGGRDARARLLGQLGELLEAGGWRLEAARRVRSGELQRASPCESSWGCEARGAARLAAEAEAMAAAEEARLAAEAHALEAARLEDEAAAEAAEAEAAEAAKVAAAAEAAAAAAEEAREQAMRRREEEAAEAQALQALHLSLALGRLARRKEQREWRRQAARLRQVRLGEV